MLKRTDNTVMKSECALSSSVLKTKISRGVCVENERFYSGETVYKVGKCSIWWKLKVCSTKTEERSPLMEKLPAQVPNWFNFMLTTFSNSNSSDWSKSCSFGWSVSCVLIGDGRAVLIGWCIGKWGYNCAVLIGWVRSVYWSKEETRAFLQVDADV